MKVEILVFDGCPNARAAERLVRETVKELNVAADIKIIHVVDNDDALTKRFLGSPSIRINGKDIEVEEDRSTQYSMRCRVYRNKNVLQGIPSKEILTAAIRAASGHPN